MNNVIVVASGKGGTGKSTVCICLSVALVKQGKKVLLIDCDCGMRGLDIMLDIEQEILFDASDAVCGNCSFGEAVYKSKHNENLYLMAAPFDAENELSPSVFTQLVDAVKDNFDYVIYPDYLKDKVTETENLVEIPSHNSISKNPFEKIEQRYAILENLI